MTIAAARAGRTDCEERERLEQEREADRRLPLAVALAGPCLEDVRREFALSAGLSSALFDAALARAVESRTLRVRGDRIGLWLAGSTS